MKASLKRYSIQINTCLALFMGYYFQAPTTNRGSGGALSRFGSLSVKVKKTTEAFNNYFNSGKSGDVFAESGGFAPSSLPPIIDSRYYRQRKHSE